MRCITWRDAPESLLQAAPLGQQLSGTPTARFFVVPLNDSAQGFGFTWIVDALEFYQFGITASGEGSHQIQDIGDAGRHASAKILPSFAKNDDHTSCHIFTGMRSHTLHDSQRTAIAHGEALTSAARSKDLASSGSIERGIAENYVFVRNETGIN